MVTKYRLKSLIYMTMAYFHYHHDIHTGKTIIINDNPITKSIKHLTHNSKSQILQHKNAQACSKNSDLLTHIINSRSNFQNSLKSAGRVMGRNSFRYLLQQFISCWHFLFHFHEKDRQKPAITLSCFFIFIFTLSFQKIIVK